MSEHTKPDFMRWICVQITTKEAKPTDLLWQQLNTKDADTLDGMGAIHFINLIRRCRDQEPLHKDRFDPTQNHNSAKKNAYLKEYRAKKKAEQDQARQS